MLGERTGIVLYDFDPGGADFLLAEVDEGAGSGADLLRSVFGVS